MMKTYKVLWLDDKFDELHHIRNDADDNGIILEGYKSFEEGKKVLQQNLYSYDAILLDAKFYLKKNQETGTEDLKGLKEAVAYINELKSKRIIPFFILSGQTRLQNDDTFKDTYGKYFKKNDPDDLEELFNTIKDAADSQQSTQIRHRYQDAFSVCREEYLGEKSAEYLIDVLLYIENGQDNSTANEKYFNSLRKLFEAFLQACNKFGFLHDELVKNGSVNQAWSIKFLSGGRQELPSGDIIFSEDLIFPKKIAEAVRHIKDITNGLSHFTSDESPVSRGEVEGSQPQNGAELLFTSPYLLPSLTYQLMHVLLWFKLLKDQNPSPELNKQKWKKVPAPESKPEDYIKGKIINKNEKGFAFLEREDGLKNCFILASMVKEFFLENGMSIEAVIEEKSKGPQVTKIKIPTPQLVTAEA